MENFETHFKKIIGGKTEEEKKENEKNVHEWVNDSIYEHIKLYECEKTEREYIIIKLVLKEIENAMKDIGIASLDLTSDKIHILKDDSVFKITDGKFRDGFASIRTQNIFIDRNESEIAMAKLLLHESLHLASCKVVQISSEKEIKPYRSGFTLYDRKNDDEYFGELEEAIVAEVAKEISEILLTKDFFKEEKEKLIEVEEWLNKLLIFKGVDEKKRNAYLNKIYQFPHLDEVLKVVRSEKDDEYKFGYLMGVFEDLKSIEYEERFEERKKLFELIKKLEQESGGAMGNSDEIFKKFVKANFTGNFLSLARDIEKYLGKGFFRKLSESTSFK